MHEIFRTFAERLKAERTRLGWNQSALGEIAGAAKRTVIEWEKGATSPNATQLMAMAAQGMNLDYVLTGTPPALRANLNDVKTATEMAQVFGGTKEQVSARQAEFFKSLREARAAKADEERLLEFYRLCLPEDQEQIRKLAERLAPTKARKK